MHRPLSAGVSQSGLCFPLFLDLNILSDDSGSACSIPLSPPPHPVALCRTLTWPLNPAPPISPVFVPSSLPDGTPGSTTDPRTPDLPGPCCRSQMATQHHRHVTVPLRGFAPAARMLDGGGVPTSEGPTYPMPEHLRVQPR